MLFVFSADILQIRGYGRKRSAEHAFDDDRREDEEYGGEIQSGKRNGEPLFHKGVARVEQSPDEGNVDSETEYGRPREDDVEKDDPTEEREKYDEGEGELVEHGKKDFVRVRI